MLSEEHISLSHYFTLGIRVFILCGILTLIYTSYFLESITSTIDYIEDKCVMKSINIENVNIDCVDTEKDAVWIVTMPCVVAIVDSVKNGNHLLYRNYAEKGQSLNQNAKCSYIPINCNNDPEFNRRVLSTYYLNLFPPVDSSFRCFIPRNENGTSDKDALIYLPDHLAYNYSLVVLVFGTLMGFAFIIYGFKFELQSPFKHKKIFQKFIREMSENHFRMTIELEKEYVNTGNRSRKSTSSSGTTSVAGNEDEEVENIELTNFSQSLRNNLTINDNISRNRSLSHEDLMKITHAGYHIGRVGYPSCSKLSFNQSVTSLRSSTESLAHSDFDRHSFDGPIFHMDLRRDMAISPDKLDLHIPSSIVEEDENSNTVTSIHDIRVKSKSKPTYSLAGKNLL